MKRKLAILLFLCLAIFPLCGCERKPYVVSFQNATMAGSDQNTLNIFFADDKKFDEKVYDIWVKSDTDALGLVINRSNQQPFEITIDKKDTWQSMTSIEFGANQKAGEEDYVGYKDAVDLIYIFQTSKEATLTFKAVTGDKIQNDTKTGYMLVNAEDVSKEFELKLSPLKD